MLAVGGGGMTDPETAPAHWDTLRFTQVNGRGLEWFWSNHVVRVERGREEKGLGSSKNRWLPCFPVLQGLTSLEPPVMTPPEPSTTESPEPPVTTSPKPPITTSPGAIPEQASTRSPRGPGLVPRNSSTRPCLPEIDLRCMNNKNNKKQLLQNTGKGCYK